MKLDKLTDKKKRLDGFRPLPDTLVRNLDDWLRVELTYTRNAIEGNTLTRRETALVVEKGFTVGGNIAHRAFKATNHAHALDWVKEQVQRKLASLSEKDILHIHDVILKGMMMRMQGIIALYPSGFPAQPLFCPIHARRLI